MSESLKRLKQIDTRTKSTVFGYIREMENTLSLFSNVPVLISYISLSYYNHGEYFHKSGSHKGMIVSEDKMTVTNCTGIKDENYDHTTYGYTWIDSTCNKIAKWKFKACGNAWICFVSKDNCEDGNCLNDTDEPNYGFTDCANNMCLKQYCNDRGNSTETKRFNMNFNVPFTVVLNAKQKTIGYYLENETKNEIKFIFENIKIGKDIKYKLAVNVPMDGDKITLMNFEID
eukprot:148821_1